MTVYSLQIVVVAPSGQGLIELGMCRLQSIRVVIQHYCCQLLKWELKCHHWVLALTEILPALPAACAKQFHTCISCSLQIVSC